MLVDKSIDQYTRMYVTPMPNESIDIGRPMKTTPVYKKLKDMGASVFRLLWLGKT